DIAHSVGLDTIQLHSEKYTEESIIFLKSLQSFRVIKAVRTSILNDPLIEKVRLTQAHALLFDSWHPSEFGGTGQRLSLHLSERSKHWLQHKAIIAGGITIENLDDVLAIGPYGIDVSSGVEKTKGVKDPSLIKAFLRRFYELVSQA
ncbi:MAG: phosphoribosylanthranilate isomerase, partial [Brevinematales bacterium]